MAAALVAAWGRDAAAQQHIHQPLIPELEIYESVAPESRHASDFANNSTDDDTDRLLWDVGTWLGSEQGVGPAPARAYGALNWGQRHSQVTWLALRSHVRAAVPDDTDRAAARESVEGRHRVVGRLGVGDPRQLPIGADAKVDARFDHVGGDDRRALSAIDIGRGGYTDMELFTELAARKTNRAHGADAAGMAFPVWVGMRRIGYLDPAAPVQEAVSRSVGGGFSFRMYDRHALDGTMTLLGLTYTRTDLIASPPAPSAAAAAAAPTPDGIDTSYSVSTVSKTRLDVGHMQMAFYDREFVLAAEGGYGWEWLRDPAHDRAVNLFVANVGVSARDDHLGVALGLGRTGEHSADGRRFVADWRVGLDVDYMRQHMGGAVRAEASWLNDKERDHGDDPGILGRYAVNSELWYQLPRDLQVGVYDLATYQPIMRASNPSWDPWAHDRALAVEMGAFLRWQRR